MRSFPRAFALATALCLAPLAPLLSPRVTLAQEEPPPPADPDADWKESFQRGIDLLRDHKLDESIRAFERCRLIKADNDPSLLDYNIACAYAQKKDVTRTVERLKKAFDGGFLDLEHVGRDTDLDPVRQEEKFTALVQATRKRVLEKRTRAVRILPKAEGKGPRPLVVFLTASGGTQDDDAARLAPVADELDAVVLVCAGKTSAEGGKSAWDSSGETCVVADVSEALADGPLAIDPARVVLVGQFGSAAIALDTAINHGWKRVVGAAGVYRVPAPADVKGARVYLIAPRGLAERAQTEATAVRDAVLTGGGQVTIERPQSRDAFGGDLAATVERAARWTLGDKVKMPGEGESHKF